MFKCLLILKFSVGFQITFCWYFHLRASSDKSSLWERKATYANFQSAVYTLMETVKEEVTHAIDEPCFLTSGTIFLALGWIYPPRFKQRDDLEWYCLLCKAYTTVAQDSIPWFSQFDFQELHEQRDASYSEHIHKLAHCKQLQRISDSP